MLHCAVMQKRPAHLTHRQTKGKAFGQTADVLRYNEGHRNEYAEWVSGGYTRTPITLAQAPVKDIRSVDVDAVTHREVRIFYTHDIDIDSVRVGRGESEGDRIDFQGRVYRVVDVSAWESDGVFTVITGMLIDPLLESATGD